MNRQNSPPTSSPPGPVLTYVRPGAGALTWLAETIRALKRNDPFRPVTVLVPNDYAGRMARWHLAGVGGYLNVSMTRLPLVAEALASDGADHERRRIQTIVEESAVRAALLDDRASAFGQISHRSLHVALLDLFRELRRQEIDLASLDSASLSTTARAALAVYRAFTGLVHEYDTPTSIADAAAGRLNRASSLPQDLAKLGAIVLWLPLRLDPAEARLLAAVAQWLPLAAAFVQAGDPQRVGDDPGRRAAGALAAALDVSLPAELAIGATLEILADIRVIRAPDPAEEVREVVRAVAADVECCVPLHRIAIAYRQGQPYAPLVRDTLDAANIPWSSSEGQRLSESRPGRCVLELLGLPDRGFTREAVMEWLETGPMLEGAIVALSTATWDRLTRSANVVRGVDQWDSRLRAMARQADDDVIKLERDDRPPTDVEATRRRGSDARILAEFIVDLGLALRPPADATTWSGFVDWVVALRDRYVGRPDRWPVPLQGTALAVGEALEALRHADWIEFARGPGLPTFLAALVGALDARRIPTGRLGEGVLIEPIAALNGLAFSRVYLVGLVDGAFPPSPAADPFFPAGGADPLDRRERQVAKERQDFLTALAAADPDPGRLTLCAPDSDGNRAAIPSRWLLEVASTRAKRPLDASTFASLQQSEHPWLRVVRSAREAVHRTEVPADREDRRLHDAEVWTSQGHPLRLHPLGRRLDLPLRRALTLERARQSEDLTEFDGNVSTLAGAARLNRSIGSQRAMSATAIQTWATCGYRYFLERVLAVEPTELPREEPTINPLERGSLIHTVLDGFFKSLARVDRPRLGERYGPDDLDAIEQVARSAFDRVEARGVIGHPLNWENSKRAIVADLRSFLNADADLRDQQGNQPALFEQGFGMGASDPASWPAHEIAVDGTVLRFRGMIDRIDLSVDRSHAFVFDYKTGSADSYASLRSDPVAAGTRVQLALYSQVVRANLPDVTAVESAFWFVSAKGNFERVSVDRPADVVDARLTRVLGTIVGGIRAGAFPAIPGASVRQSFANCGYCAFDRVCPPRRDQTAARKANHPFSVRHASLGGSTQADGEE